MKIEANSYTYFSQMDKIFILHQNSHMKYKGYWCIAIYTQLQGRINELNQALVPSTLQVRAALVDPLVNNLCNRLKAELLAYKEKAEEARADLEAVKFAPDRYVFMKVPE